jgi:hypothetical protein
VHSRKSPDREPGAIPDIRPDGDGLIYLVPVPAVHATARLLIRADADGNLWASLGPAEPGERDAE